MISTKFYLKEPTCSSPTLVYLVVRHNKQALKHSIGIKVLPKDWNPVKQRLKRTSPNALLVNEKLNYYERKVHQYFLDRDFHGKVWTVRSLKEYLTSDSTSPVPTSLTGLFELYIDSHKHLYKKRTVISYNNALRTITRFMTTTNLENVLDTVDTEFYNRLLWYLYSPPNSYSINNAGRIIKHLKTVLNYGARKGLITNYEFKEFKKPSQRVNNVYLNRTELDTIDRLENLPGPHTKCRDLFLVLCYTGIRFDDLKNLGMNSIDDIEGGHVIKLLTTKTGVPVVIPLHPIVQRILNKYKGKLPKISNVKFNLYIKEVVRLAGITQTIRLVRSSSGIPTEVIKKKYEAISSHTGRRSFITNLHIEKVDLHSIKLLSGHQDIKVLDQYIKLSLEENATEMLKHPFFKDSTS